MNRIIERTIYAVIFAGIMFAKTEESYPWIGALSMFGVGMAIIFFPSVDQTMENRKYEREMKKH